MANCDFHPLFYFFTMPSTLRTVGITIVLSDPPPSPHIHTDTTIVFLCFQSQGVEVPTEGSNTTDDTITQSAVFTFFMELLPHPAPPDPAPRGNSGESNGAEPFWGAPPDGACCCSGANEVHPPPNNTCHGKPPYNASCLVPGQCSWAGVWRYRRSTVGHSDGPPVAGIASGDVSMQNWGHGNDMPAANLMLPIAEVCCARMLCVPSKACVDGSLAC